MKKPLSILVLLILPQLLIAQLGFQKSYLYNDKGQLYADTNLQLTKSQLKRWSSAENEIINSISKTKYPPIAQENGVEAILLVAFDCDSIELKNIRFIKKVGYGFEEAVNNQIINSSPLIIKSLNEGKKLELSETYYLVINFALIKFYEELKLKHAIPVLNTTSPLLGKDIYCPGAPNPH